MSNVQINEYCRYYSKTITYQNSKGRRVQEETQVTKCDPCKHADAIVKTHGQEYGLRMIAGLAASAPKGSFWENCNGYAKRKYSKKSKF
jgi:hypothetical protein